MTDYVDSVTGLPVPYLSSTNGAASVTQDTLPGSENLSDSASSGFKAVRGKRKATIIGLTTAITINTGVASDTMLHGVLITAALTGTCVITGFGDSAGAATSITLPAATTAGFKEFGDVINDVGALTITCSNASDDNLVTVVWSSLV